MTDARQAVLILGLVFFFGVASWHVVDPDRFIRNKPYTWNRGSVRAFGLLLAVLSGCALYSLFKK